MKYILIVILTVLLGACGGKSGKNIGGPDTIALAPCPTFNTDTCMRYIREQCSFGPRVTGTAEAAQCRQYLISQFQRMGATVEEQQANVTLWDGSERPACNIIARLNPGNQDRILICSHWDSRPWADNDPDEQNWRTPVIAANDGASGVAVMLELARLISRQGSATTTAALNPQLGIDFICFDAEDWGTPQWAESESTDTWALGAQHWARHPHREGYSARYGILLDMVGGQGARFYREGYSMQYAPAIVSRVWQAAQVVGYGGYFPQSDGGYITDDHVPVNQLAGIPCIDIIPFYPDCAESSFGPTWHTVNDDMDHIDRQTLGAVGQTLVQVLFSE